jgi:hypothetical protein
MIIDIPVIILSSGTETNRASPLELKQITAYQPDVLSSSWSHDCNSKKFNMG